MIFTTYDKKPSHMYSVIDKANNGVRKKLTSTGIILMIAIRLAESGQWAVKCGNDSTDATTAKKPCRERIRVRYRPHTPLSHGRRVSFVEGKDVDRL